MKKPPEWRHPPVEHQFKPGISGNYAGRPKKERPGAAVGREQQSNVPALAEAARLIPISADETVPELAVLRAILRIHAIKAIKGDPRSAELFLHEHRLAEKAAKSEAELSFKQALESKIALTAQVLLAERKMRPMPKLHPDQIVLMADQSFEMLPSVAAVEERRTALESQANLRQETLALQKDINRSPPDVTRLTANLKMKLRTLRQLRRRRLIPDFPGIEEQVLVSAQAQVTQTHNISFATSEKTMTHEELIAEAEKRGLPTRIFLE
jgi:hypothetical protein